MTTKKMKKEQPIASETASETTKPDQDLQDFNRLTETVHKGFWNAAEALCEIKSRKLYLCPKDKNGNPCFKTFDDYLNAEYGFGRSNFCRMSKAYQAYKLLYENYGESQPALLKAIPENIDPFYEISMIPQEQVESAISDLAQDVANGIAITASHIRQWRTDHQQDTPTDKPATAGLHEEVEAESPTFTINSETTLEEDGNAIEITPEQVDLDEHEISKIIKDHDNATETNDQVGTEEEEEEEDDDDVVQQIRKIANRLISDKFIEYFAKDNGNYQWLKEIVEEVGDRVANYMGQKGQEYQE